MGFLSKVFGAIRAPSVKGESDRVWWSREVCNAAIVQDLWAAQDAGAGVLVLAHFETALKGITGLVGGDGESIEGMCMLVRGALERRFKHAVQLVLVAERHPLRSEDDAIVGWAQAQFPEAKVVFYVALDDPLLLLFGGERTRDLLKKLGMKETEPIQHPAIDRALRNAQDKVAAKAGVATPRATSAADWLGQIGLGPESQ